MKQLKLLLYFFTFALALTSCGDSSNGEGNGEKTTSQERNANKNVVGSENAVSRLEFPKLKGGNSIVIVHRTSGDTEYDKDGVNYSVEWDCSKKSQRWSCYIMTAANKAKKTTRYYGDPQYPEDPNLDSSQSWDRDYISGSSFGTGASYDIKFDHGHICPSNDRLYSYEANYQTFYLTNMQPQYKVFNGSHRDHEYKGLWINMENFVYNLKLGSSDTLFVCKGGTIDNEEQILTRISGKFIVPKYFFAALLLKNSQGYRALAFWFEHTNVYHGDDDLADYAISIDKLEELTGIDFFCNLPDATEDDVEGKVSLFSWGLK